MKAIVLSGGGAKGAYELGVWKALRKLRINYDIVTGTSIGALNGLLMAQNDYFRCLNLWGKISFDLIYDDFNNEDMYKGYIEKLKEGGIDTSKIEKIIYDVYDPKKLYNSKIKYGVVSVTLPDMKEKYSTTLNTKPDKLPKYILASATCFPFFKPANIDNKLHIDGGFYDNLPINLAVDLGATEVIAVDLRAIGIKRKVEKDVKITYITPNNRLDSFLNFDNTSAKQMIKLGYNDTMKVYKKLEGNIFTFVLGSLHKNYLEYGNDFNELVDIYFNQNLSEIYINKVLEDALEVFEVNTTKVYKEYNSILLTKINKTELIEDMSIKELKKILKRKTIVKYIYNKLLNKEDCTIYKILKKEFLIALYLITIGGNYGEDINRD